MGNAVWLFLETPEWYFNALGALFSGAHVFALNSLLGIVCFATGVIWGLVIKAERLMWFLISPVVSQGFVAFAGFFRGQIMEPWSGMVLWSFLALQAVLLFVFVNRARGARVPALFLTVFCLTYALFASFVSAMSMADSWL